MLQTIVECTHLVGMKPKLHGMFIKLWNMFLNIETIYIHYLKELKKLNEPILRNSNLDLFIIWKNSENMRILRGFLSFAFKILKIIQ